MVLEGRHGNSIRIGSRDVNPYIILSNGRATSNVVESTNDGTLMAILNSGKLWDHFTTDSKIDTEGEVATITRSPFVVASDIALEDEEKKRLMGEDLFGYEYDNNQTLLSSGKITINSNKNNSTISSKNNTIIGSGNITHMVSENATIIEASNIYLGRQAEEQNEPVVLGTKLKDFLQEFLDLFAKTHALVQGVPVPVTDALMKPLVPQIKALSNKLKNPEFWSEYHFVEDNGNKPV